MTMTTKEEIEQAYPDVVAEIRSDAVAKERKRVALHLSFGRKSGLDSGGMSIALQSIESGAEMTGELMEQHMDARERQRQINLRDEDAELVNDVCRGLGPSRERSGPSALADEVERQARHAPGRSVL